jgi:hypothetical protein
VKVNFYIASFYSEYYLSIDNTVDLKLDFDIR